MERLSQRGGGGGGGGGAAVLDSCRAKRPKPYKNNSRPCFGTTKHHSEIKDVREQLTEYTIHSFVSHKRQAGQTNLRLFLNCKKSKLIPCKKWVNISKSQRTAGDWPHIWPILSLHASQRPTLARQIHTHPRATLSLKQTQG